MPHFASKKQYRMMMAILHGGKKGKTKRGDSGPPKSVIEDYTGSSKDLPEDKGKEQEGGHWGESKSERHSKQKEHKKHTQEKIKEETSKLKEKNMRKSEKKSGIGVLVVDESNRILMGRHTDRFEWALPGGSIDLNETDKEAAVRELEEETGLKISSSRLETLDDVTFLVRVNSGESDLNVKDTDELSDVGFMNLSDIDLSDVRDCCISSLKSFIRSKMSSRKKSVDLMFMQKIEQAEKQLELHPVFSMPKKDCLTLVANALHRHLDPHLNMTKEDDVVKVPFSSYVITVRKHRDNKKSGHVDDGGKTIHRFTGLEHEDMLKDIMSLFEWIDSDSNGKIKILSPDKLSDETIEDGITKMVDNYRSYNLGDIYDEIENIRQEIRQGNAVDLQQAESRIVSLFDKLEDRLLNVEKKHNSLVSRAGEDIDEIEKKLRELQSKLESTKAKKPSTVEAVSSSSINPNKVSRDFYPYLSKPIVTIKPNGHIIINFSEDWTDDEKSNFLEDLKAKALKKKKK